MFSVTEYDRNFSHNNACTFSCPFDRVTIYDGPDNLAEKIGTYCGQMRNLVIYSTKECINGLFEKIE